MAFTIACLQLTLSGINIFTWVCGMALVGLGIVFLVDPTMLSYLEVAGVGGNEHLALAISVITLTVGALMFIVSFPGFFGACMPNICLLETYGVLVFLLVVLQLSGFVLAVIHNQSLGETLKSGMEDFLINDYDGGNTSLSQSWDYTQVNMKCCGVSDKCDYEDLNTYWFKDVSTDGWRWPLTCCVLINDDPVNPEPENECGCYNDEMETVHHQGCYEELAEWLETWGWAIALLLLGFMILQIMIAACACCLVGYIKRDLLVDIV